MPKKATNPKSKSTSSTNVKSKGAQKKDVQPKEVDHKQTTSKVETSVAKSTEMPDSSEQSHLTGEFTSFLAKLQQATQLLSTLKSDFRQLEKKATRELRVAQKASAKRKKRASNRSPSGFVKPTLISKELATFLGKDEGTMMARTEVTREINVYIRTHNLQDPKNGRVIKADTRLSKLLKLGKGDELTYFNLQKYMSPHFAKAGSTTVTSSTQ